jgi:hypothetical protein
MPASRYWEFEFSDVNFGAVDARPEDLARFILIEFALIYGNDFFVIPFELEVGSICQIQSLEVIVSFGKKINIEPIIKEGGDTAWRMFCLSHERDSKASNLFFLPPVLGTTLQGPPVEEVHFLRDEMANMAWAVESTIQNPLGRPLNRFEGYQKEKQNQEYKDVAMASPSEHLASMAYRLASSVPSHWIPLLPKRFDNSSIKLNRGAMLRIQPDGTIIKIEPEGSILEPGHDLNIYEEVVSRAGVKVTRVYQYARWIDGSSHLWVGKQKMPGCGEGSSGLRFDIAETL